MRTGNPFLAVLRPIAANKSQRWMLEALRGAYAGDFELGLEAGHEQGRDIVLEELERTAARQRALTPRLLPRAFKTSHDQLLGLLKSIAKAGGRLLPGRHGHPTRLSLGGASFEHLGQALVKLDIRAPELQPTEILRKRRAIQMIKEHHPELRALGVRQLSLFGSVARDEARPDSDVDFVVEFDGPVTSDRFFETKFLLEDLLGRRVDLVTAGALREPVRAAIAAERVDVA